MRDLVTSFSDLYSSVHRGTGYKSRLSTDAYEEARERVAKFLGVDEDEQVVIFVKGTTDALNRIAAEEARLDGRQVLVTRWSTTPTSCRGGTAADTSWSASRKMVRSTSTR